MSPVILNTFAKGNKMWYAENVISIYDKQMITVITMHVFVDVCINYMNYTTVLYLVVSCSWILFVSINPLIDVRPKN